MQEIEITKDKIQKIINNAFAQAAVDSKFLTPEQCGDLLISNRDPNLDRLLAASQQSNLTRTSPVNCIVRKVIKCQRFNF